MTKFDEAEIIGTKEYFRMTMVPTIFDMNRTLTGEKVTKVICIENRNLMEAIKEVFTPFYVNEKHNLQVYGFAFDNDHDSHMIQHNDELTSNDLYIIVLTDIGRVCFTKERAVIDLLTKM